jgi:hypothetical protein
MPIQDGYQAYGTQLLFADHATDFENSAPATAANSLVVGTPTNVQMNLSEVANGALWQSAKTGSLAIAGASGVWPKFWLLGACVEHTATPAAGTTCTWYWNPSPSDTAGTGNSGGCSGADAAYSAAGTAQLIRIGTMTLRNTVINIDTRIGKLWTPHLFGSLVFANDAGVAMVADADADEIHATLTPVFDRQVAA